MAFKAAVVVTLVRCDNTGLTKPECSCPPCQQELIAKHAPDVGRPRRGDRRAEFTDYDGPTGLWVATGEKIVPMASPEGARAMVESAFAIEAMLRLPR